MHHQAAIFDLDGTLLDSLEDIAQATNRTLQAQGFPTHPLTAYMQFIGDGMTKLILRALPPEHRTEPTISRCVEFYRQDYGANWNVHTRLYDGIADLLDGLLARRIQLAILSNKPDEFVQHCVRQYLSAWPFAVIMGASSDFPHKPDPSAALAIARRMQLPAAQILYLGDMEVDMATAHAAGMTAIGAGWGFRSREQLTAAGADFVIDSPHEMLQLI